MIEKYYTNNFFKFLIESYIIIKKSYKILWKIICFFIVFYNIGNWNVIKNVYEMILNTRKVIEFQDNDKMIYELIVLLLLKVMSVIDNTLFEVL